MKKGVFITIEGGEGTGKSTLITMLTKALTERGYDAIQTREPGGSNLSEKIREWVLTRDKDISVGSRAELLLYLAARAQHVDEFIASALSENKIVLCDRFNDSTVAYQGVARNLGFEDVEKMCSFACGDILPDTTILLDIAPEIGLDRVRDFDRLDAESIEFHYDVRKGYRMLAELYPHRIKIVDATPPLEDVYQQAWKILEEELPASIKG